MPKVALGFVIVVIQTLNKTLPYTLSFLPCEFLGELLS